MGNIKMVCNKIDSTNVKRVLQKGKKTLRN